MTVIITVVVKRTYYFLRNIIDKAFTWCSQYYLLRSVHYWCYLPLYVYSIALVLYIRRS